MYLSVLTIETLVLSLVGTSTCCTTESQATRECYTICPSVHSADVLNLQFSPFVIKMLSQA